MLIVQNWELNQQRVNVITKRKKYSHSEFENEGLQNCFAFLPWWAGDIKNHLPNIKIQLPKASEKNILKCIYDSNPGFVTYTSIFNLKLLLALRGT